VPGALRRLVLERGDATEDPKAAVVNPGADARRNVDALRAKVVLPGANIAVTADAEHELHQRGVPTLPDLIANAGGVKALGTNRPTVQGRQALCAAAT
jgi:Glutamate/Leucine/Phenylalanine/Valine dehydrogenase